MPPAGRTDTKAVVQLSGNDTLTIFIQLPNDTSSQGEGTGQEGYDGNGAMRFIIATLLVYSLMGIVGVMLLKIRKSTTKSQRMQAAKEESVQKYMKQMDKLRLQGYREALKIETSRTLHRILSIHETPSVGATAVTTPCVGDQATSPGSDNGTESTLLIQSPLSLEEFTYPVSPSTVSTSASVQTESMSRVCDDGDEDKDHP